MTHPGAGGWRRLLRSSITVELPDGMAATASIGAGEVRSNTVTGDVSLYSDRGTVTVNDGSVGQIRANVGLLGGLAPESDAGRCASVRLAAVACEW